MKRKEFLKNSAALGLGFSVLSHTAFGMGTTASNPYSFVQLQQSPLKYGLDGLNGAIDKQIMDLHYNKHAAGYLKKLSGFLAKNEIPGTDLFSLVQGDLEADFLRNNLGGHFNHEIFWRSMTPRITSVGMELMQKIEEDFGSWEKMLEAFSTAAATVFGSGWAWLILEASTGKLKIVQSANQNNPLMKGESNFGYPLVGIDVWEHAYYLQYQNRRKDYIQAFAGIVDWDFADTMYHKILNWKS